MVRIYDFVDVIDGIEPPPGRIESDGMVTFDVDVLQPVLESVRSSWWLDETLIAADKETVQVDLRRYPGEHTLRLCVIDDTPVVRQDPYVSPQITETYPRDPEANRRESERFWTLLGTGGPYEASLWIGR